jgi:hypothetical protein
MRRALPRLLDLMVDERAEVERWLASDWSPLRRWVISDDDYHPMTTDTVADQLAGHVADEWRGGCLGFVDDEERRLWNAWRAKHGEPLNDSPLTAWRVVGDSRTGRAWRVHVAHLLRSALDEALATFPLHYVGQELKDALTGRGGYGADDADGAIEELLGGLLGQVMPFSDAACDYVRLRYDPDPSYMLDASEPDGYWWTYRVLDDDIMAILDAVRAANPDEAR